MLPSIKSFFDPKVVWRERMKAARKEAAQARPDAPRHAARAFFDAIDVRDGAVVSLYRPIQTELDPGPIVEELFNRAATVALPVVEQKNAPLVFRVFKPGDTLTKGVYGAFIPGEDAEIVTPSIIVLPLLGFTRAGDRLGYGGGYYDRTLEDLRGRTNVIAVGYAYAGQEVEIDALPTSRLDQRLDWIVTERGAIRCS